MYSDTGGDGPVVVFLHGVLMNGTLWDGIVDKLRGRYRCLVPELPFGAHRTPMPDDADLDLGSLARMIAGFLDELDLRRRHAGVQRLGRRPARDQPGRFGPGRQPRSRVL